MFEKIGTSYVYRTEVGFVSASEDDKAVDFSDVKLSVAEVVILADGQSWHFARRPNVITDYFFDGSTSSGFRNTLFADGHAKALPEQKFFLLWVGGLGVP